MNKNEELEREAIAFYRSIPKYARTASLRGFLRRLAEHLGWDQLKGEL
jgi:rubrerythrin